MAWGQSLGKKRLQHGLSKSINQVNQPHGMAWGQSWDKGYNMGTVNQSIK